MCRQAENKIQEIVTLNFKHVLQYVGDQTVKAQLIEKKLGVPMQLWKTHLPKLSCQISAQNKYC